MRRPWLLSVLLFSAPVVADDPNPVLEEARAVMREGLERELPAPTRRGPAQWPAATPPVPVERKTKDPEKQKDELQQKRDTLAERVRNEASLRARTAAEERRAAPENNQGPSQSRTKAAKSMGPKPKPPRP